MVAPESGKIRRLSPVVSLGRFFGIDSRRALAWVVIASSIVCILFAVQYLTYGTERYLGWDTSRYVQRARGIEVFGPGYLLSFYGEPGPTNNYPNLYYHLLWIIGVSSGNIGAGERVLPILMGIVLVAIYYRLGRELFREPGVDLAGITAVVAALSPSTMRLLSDLHRNLFALIASLALLIVLAEFFQGKRSRKSAFGWLVALSAIAAYSQIETFAVVLLVVVFNSLLTRKAPVFAIGSMSLPLLAAAPLMVNYYVTYGQWGFGNDPADLPLAFSDIVLFHGGVLPLVPLSALGVAILALRSKEGASLPRLLLIWYGILMILVAVLWLTDSGVPATRPLFLVPIPILLTLGIREVARVLSGFWARLAGKVRRRENSIGRSLVLPRSAAVSTIVLLVVLATTLGLWTTKDKYMQPYISEEHYSELQRAGTALLPYASESPVLVFSGHNGAWFHSISGAYVGAWSGPVFGYFGRPQFLLSLTDPLVAEPGLPDDPDPSRFVATQLYRELTAVIGSPSDLRTHPIVVSAPSMYDRPVSDYFIVRHRVSPGLYLVPPGGTTQGDRDTWMWFGAYDSKLSSTFERVSYPWSLSPHVLEYSVPSLSNPWITEYLMLLDRDIANASLSIHIEDTPPFPTQWNVQPSEAGAFTLWVDEAPVARYVYGNQGVRWVNLTLDNMRAGFHTVRLQADEVGKPFAIALDALVFYPAGVTLQTILEAYQE